MSEPRLYYRRHLPHYQPLEAEYHVVFRLKGSLPIEAINRLREERDSERKRALTPHAEEQKRDKHHKLSAAYFAEFDNLLDNPSTMAR
jgi:putative transposase